MDRLHALAAVSGHRRDGQRGEQREQAGAVAALAEYQRRLHDGPLEIARRQEIVGALFGKVEAAARALVRAESRDLHHAAHACHLAGLEQRARRGVVERVERARPALAQDSHRVHHCRHAFQAGQPGLRPQRAFEAHRGGDDLVPRGAQGGRRVPPDEPGGAEDEDFQAASAETSRDTGR